MTKCLELGTFGNHPLDSAFILPLAPIRVKFVSRQRKT